MQLTHPCSLQSLACADVSTIAQEAPGPYQKHQVHELVLKPYMCVPLSAYQEQMSSLSM
jgi:hypothetical protein